MESKTKNIIDDDKKSILSDSSLWLLVAINGVTIFLAVSEGWSFATILWTYWFQSVIIGLVNFIRILTVKNFTDSVKFKDKENKIHEGSKIKSAVFFAVHYGFFHLIYAAFLFVVPDDRPDMKNVLFVAGAFLVNHFYSFFYNKRRDEKKVVSLRTLMARPYGRIIPMHLTIIFGPLLGAVALPFFLILKTIADIISHVREHRSTVVDRYQSGTGKSL
jgi:hypothetical protein